MAAVAGQLIQGGLRPIYGWRGGKKHKVARGGKLSNVVARLVGGDGGDGIAA